MTDVQVQENLAIYPLSTLKMSATTSETFVKLWIAAAVPEPIAQLFHVWDREMWSSLPEPTINLQNTMNNYQAFCEYVRLAVKCYKEKMDEPNTINCWLGDSYLKMLVKWAV